MLLFSHSSVDNKDCQSLVSDILATHSDNPNILATRGKVLGVACLREFNLIVKSER